MDGHNTRFKPFVSRTPETMFSIYIWPCWVTAKQNGVELQNDLFGLGLFALLQFLLISLYVFLYVFPQFTLPGSEVTSLLPVLSAFSQLLGEKLTLVLFQCCYLSLTVKIMHCTAGISNHDFGSPGLTEINCQV